MDSIPAYSSTQVLMLIWAVLSWLSSTFCASETYTLVNCKLFYLYLQCAAPHSRARGTGPEAERPRVGGVSAGSCGRIPGPSSPLRLSRGLQGSRGPAESVSRGAGRAADLPSPGDAPESGWIGPFPGSSRCRGTSATSESGSLSPQGARIRISAGRRRGAFLIAW